jgi:hypothetical protein
MLSYHLAKQLKDAGFLQELTEDSYRFILSDSTVKRGSEPFPSSLDNAKLPTLSELIEACGVHSEGLPVFKQLNWHAKRQNGIVATPQGGVNADEVGYWSAKARKGKGLSGHVTAWGKTAEEAVANLWLALNSK